MASRVRKAVEAVEELCKEHFPHGWSHVEPQFAAVGCEHGSYERPAEQAPQQGAGDGDQSQPGAGEPGAE